MVPSGGGSAVRRRPSRGRARIDGMRGVSILETVVALALVTMALAALAPVLVRATLLLADAREETLALALATSRLHDLEALDFYQDAGTGGLGTDVTTNLASRPRTRSGPGLLAGDPAGAWRNLPGGWDWTTSGGRPTNDPADAAFLRRWAVSRLPAPLGTERLLVQVCARSRAREEREGVRASAAHRPGDVWLFSVRTRQLR